MLRIIASHTRYMRVSYGQQKKLFLGQKATETIQDIHYLGRYGRLPKFMYWISRQTLLNFECLQARSIRFR